MQYINNGPPSPVGEAWWPRAVEYKTNYYHLGASQEEILGWFAGNTDELLIFYNMVRRFGKFDDSGTQVRARLVHSSSVLLVVFPCSVRITSLVCGCRALWDVRSAPFLVCLAWCGISGIASALSATRQLFPSILFWVPLGRISFFSVRRFPSGLTRAAVACDVFHSFEHMT